MNWRRVNRFLWEREDGARVCACHARGADEAVSRRRWMFRASRPDGSWAGPVRETADEARGDLDAALRAAGEE